MSRHNPTPKELMDESRRFTRAAKAYLALGDRNASAIFDRLAAKYAELAATRAAIRSASNTETPT